MFGRSSVGRLGLFVEITAPIGDIGFHGQWTLMLSPIRCGAKTEAVGAGVGSAAALPTPPATSPAMPAEPAAGILGTEAVAFKLMPNCTRCAVCGPPEPHDSVSRWISWNEPRDAA